MCRELSGKDLTRLEIECGCHGDTSPAVSQDRKGGAGGVSLPWSFRLPGSGESVHSPVGTGEEVAKF